MAIRPASSGAGSSRRSSGRLRSTGPGRPVVALRNASSSAPGSAATSRTSRAQRQSPPNAATRSTSWNASRPRDGRSTWPTIAISGAESAWAAWRAIARFAAPTARVTMTAAGRPVSAPWAAAMNPAPPSCRAATTRMPAATSPSSSGRKLSPGTVYATRTPAPARASAMKRPASRLDSLISVRRRWERAHDEPHDHEDHDQHDDEPHDRRAGRHRSLPSPIGSSGTGAGRSRRARAAGRSPSAGRPCSWPRRERRPPGPGSSPSGTRPGSSS